MRVITLENIEKYIEDKTGNPQKVTRTTIHKGTRNTDVTVIHDNMVVCPEVYLDENNEIKLKENEGVHCILTRAELLDYDSEHPFIRSREAVSGTLIIDGNTPKEADLFKYFFKL